MALIQWKQIDPQLREDGQLTGSLYLSGSQAVTGDLTVGGKLTAQEYHSELVSASVLYESGSSLFGNSLDDTHLFTGSVNITGSLVVNGTTVGEDASIRYISESTSQSLSEIEVLDYDNNVAVDFTGGRLKFIFGEPATPTSLNASLSGFATDRFNKETDAYTINGSWSNGGYTLISASLYEGTTLLEQVGSGTTLSYSTTTSGSHSYRLEYTASSPLDGTLYKNSDTVTGTLSKIEPTAPSVSFTPTVQLGTSSNQIEQGATGSIAYTVSSGTANGWEETSLDSGDTYYITGSATGSNSISFSVSAGYQSPLGENEPQLSKTKNSSRTYSKIRSVRYGASADTSFTQTELEDLSSWDTTLGGSIGTIIKGDTNPSGNSVTISWSGDKYHYIVFDSSRSNLSNITTNGFGVLGQFSVSTVGSYKVYRTNTLQAGAGGSSITYVLS